MTHDDERYKKSYREYNKDYDKEYSNKEYSNKEYNNKEYDEDIYEKYEKYKNYYIECKEQLVQLDEEYKNKLIQQFDYIEKLKNKLFEYENHITDIEKNIEQNNGNNEKNKYIIECLEEKCKKYKLKYKSLKKDKKENYYQDKEKLLYNINSLTQEKYNLLQTIDKLKQNISNHNNDISSKEKLFQIEFHKLMEKNTKLIEDISNKNKLIIDLQQNLNVKENEISMRLNEKYQKEYKIFETKIVNDNKEKENNQKTMFLKRINNLKTDLSSQTNIYENEKNELKEQFKLAILKNQGEIYNQNKQIQNLQNINEKLKLQVKDNENYKKEMSNLFNENMKLTDKVNNLNKEKKTLMSDINRKEQIIQNLIQANEEQKIYVENEKKRQFDNNTLIKNLKNNIKQYQNNINKYEREIKDLKEKYINLNELHIISNNNSKNTLKENTILKNEIKNVNDNLKNKTEYYLKNIKERDTEIDKYKKLKTKLNEQLTNLTKRIYNEDKENVKEIEQNAIYITTCNKLEEIEEINKKLKIELEQRNEEFFTNEINCLLGENGQLRNKIKMLNNNIYNLQQQLMNKN